MMFAKVAWHNSERPVLDSRCCSVRHVVFLHGNHQAGSTWLSTVSNFRRARTEQGRSRFTYASLQQKAGCAPGRQAALPPGLVVSKTCAGSDTARSSRDLQAQETRATAELGPRL